MRLAWMSVLTVAACGRLGFDPTHGDGHGPGSGDAGSKLDGDFTIGTDGGPHAEVCNGIDDNLDGLIDENCPCTPFAFPVASDDALGLVWVGDHYVTITTNGGTAEVHPIANDGTFGATLGSVAYVPDSYVPAMAWNGIRLAIAATGGGSAAAVMFDLQNSNTVSNVIGNADNVLVARRGDHFAFAFNSGSSYHVREVSGGAIPITDPSPVTIADTTLAGFAAGPNGYALLTVGPGSVHVTVLDLAGAIVGGPTDMSFGGGMWFNITASIGGYAVTSKSAGVSIRILDTTGQIIAAPTLPSTFGAPSNAVIVAAADRYHVIGEIPNMMVFDTALYDYDFAGTLLPGAHSLGYSFGASNGYARLTASTTSQRLAVTAKVANPGFQAQLIQRCE